MKTDTRRVTRRRRAGGSTSHPPALGQYFQDVSRHAPMTAEQEQFAARQLRTLRTALWSRLLTYLPFVDGLLDVAESYLQEDAPPKRRIADLRRSSRALRDRDTSEHRRAFEKDRLWIAGALGRLDRDGVVGDRVMADLQRLRTGNRRTTSLEVHKVRCNSKPFQAYVRAATESFTALQHAKHRFAQANLRLVVRIAQRYAHGQMPLSDIVQEGNVGLLKAVGRFDPERGFRFSTYGSWLIRSAITRAIADKGRCIRVPSRTVEALQRIKKSREALETTLGRLPSIQDVGEDSGLSPQRVEELDIVLTGSPLSLDQPRAGDDARNLADVLFDSEAEQPGDRLEAEGLSRELRRALTCLRPVEADIIRSRFGLDDHPELTLRQIGERHALSRERIRQLQETALSRVRRELERRRAI